MFFCNQGAITGGIIAMALILWMGLGQQVAVASGTYGLEQKPTSIEQCPCLNSTLKLTEIKTDTHNDYKKWVTFTFCLL